ncbi:MAG: membrane protein insertion efficiency factor YidD [Actinomycetota bacterium]
MRALRDLTWRAGAPVRLALLALVRTYRVTLGGLTGGQCRFYPTCSMYAEEAIRVHGAFRGTLMSTWRVLRCGPFTAGGVDPVPRSRRHGSYDEVIQRAAS